MDIARDLIGYIHESKVVDEISIKPEFDIKRAGLLFNSKMSDSALNNVRVKLGEARDVYRNADGIDKAIARIDAILAERVQAGKDAMVISVGSTWESQSKGRVRINRVYETNDVREQIEFVDGNKKMYVFPRTSFLDEFTVVEAEEDVTIAIDDNAAECNKESDDQITDAHVPVYVIYSRDTSKILTDDNDNPLTFNTESDARKYANDQGIDSYRIVDLRGNGIGAQRSEGDNKDSGVDEDNDNDNTKGVDKKVEVRRAIEDESKWVFEIWYADLVDGEIKWRLYPNVISDRFSSKSKAEASAAKYLQTDKTKWLEEDLDGDNKDDIDGDDDMDIDVEVVIDHTINTNGTSLLGKFPEGTSYADLYNVFGEPTMYSDPDSKVRAHWSGKVNGEVFTIYDYKQDEVPVRNVTDWHIGGKAKDYNWSAIVDPLISYFKSKLGSKNTSEGDGGVIRFKLGDKGTYNEEEMTIVGVFPQDNEYEVEVAGDSENTVRVGFDDKNLVVTESMADIPDDNEIDEVSKKNARKDRLEKHYRVLADLANKIDAPVKDGKKLSTELFKLEKEASRLNVMLSNGEIEDKEYDAKARKIVKKVQSLLGDGLRGFMLDSEPRGYALKIDVDKLDVDLPRGLGGFGLLAPDLSEAVDEGAKDKKDDSKAGQDDGEGKKTGDSATAELRKILKDVETRIAELPPEEYREVEDLVIQLADGKKEK